MDLVPDDETKGFSFIWTIHNFSYCLLKKRQPFISPLFKLNLADTCEWYLKIYPRASDVVDTIGVFLGLKSNGPFPVKVGNQFSIRSIQGAFKKRNGDCPSMIFEREAALGYADFLNYSNLFKNIDDFLKNDILTLRCRIWKEHTQLPVSGKCYARTVNYVTRIVFDWPLGNFEEFLLKKRKTYDIHEVLSPIPSFTVDIFLSGEVYSERKIQVEIKLTDASQELFMTCKLSLLDSDGKTAHSVQDDHWFDDPPETNWTFTFMPVKKILEHDRLYLVNGTLSLRCELAVSFGMIYSEVERIEFTITDEDDEARYNKVVDTSLPGCWKENLQHFYKEKKFSDLTIRTASNKEFLVHKIILCARSEVFSAMFEHDTKEKRTSVVEIEDLTDDTVSRMLLFTYTDIVEDLEWGKALELYYAADKYGIVGLKRECSTFLKEKLNNSNVCEVLVLADMHQDQDLKSVTHNFLIDHAAEILNSEYWMKFMKDNCNLAAEAMHFLCVRNFKT